MPRSFWIDGNAGQVSFADFVKGSWVSCPRAAEDSGSTLGQLRVELVCERELGWLPPSS